MNIEKLQNVKKAEDLIHNLEKKLFLYEKENDSCMSKLKSVEVLFEKERQKCKQCEDNYIILKSSYEEDLKNASSLLDSKVRDHYDAEMRIKEQNAIQVESHMNEKNLLRERCHRLQEMCASIQAEMSSQKNIHDVYVETHERHLQQQLQEHIQQNQQRQTAMQVSCDAASIHITTMQNDLFLAFTNKLDECESKIKLFYKSMNNIIEKLIKDKNDMQLQIDNKSMVIEEHLSKVNLYTNTIAELQKKERILQEDIDELLRNQKKATDIRLACKNKHSTSKVSVPLRHDNELVRNLQQECLDLRQSETIMKNKHMHMHREIVSLKAQVQSSEQARNVTERRLSSLQQVRTVLRQILFHNYAQPALPREPLNNYANI